MKIRRIMSAVLAISLVLISTVEATYEDSNKVIASRISRSISPGLKFSQSIELFKGIRQEIFTFEYTPGSETEIVPAFGDHIYGFNSVGNMIRSYKGDGRVVGGINTDFYITDTGIPLSCLVSEKEIITSCDNRIALGFDKDGNAIIGYPEISSEIVSVDGQKILPVAHINKTPGIWGLYLVTDKFHNTTKSLKNSIEIIFMPYDRKQTDENFIEYHKNISETSKSDDLPVIYYDNNDEYELNTEIATSEISNINQYNFGQQYINEVKLSQQSDTSENLSIMSETEFKTNNEPPFDLFVYENKPIEINSAIDIVVKEVREQNSDGDIPEGCYVACIPEEFRYLADGIDVGDRFMLHTTINEMFENSLNIFGAGTQIIKDGAIVPQDGTGIFNIRNPRTAAGIREDGTVLFICVDGRNPGKSSGYTITELSQYLLDQGCIDAINFDGGGSTTFYAADIGEDKAALKNTPSDGWERRVADGLLFVNISEKTGISKNAALYPGEYFIFNKDANVEISDKVLFADSNFHPILTEMSDNTFYIDEEYGDLSDGIFISNGKVGVTAIFVVNNNIDVPIEAGKIIITDFVDDLKMYASSDYLSPFDENVELSIEASLHTMPVNITNNSANWSVWIEDHNFRGELHLVPEYEKYIDLENGVFTPIERGYTYYIECELGGQTERITVNCEDYPFVDMNDHWAIRTAYDMYKQNLFVGEEHNDEMLFFPDRNMTRAEFCTVLARLLELNTDYYPKQNIQENDSLPENEIITEMDVDTIDHESVSNTESEEDKMQNLHAEQGEDEVLLNAVDSDNSNSDEKEEYILNGIPDWAKGSVYALYRMGYINSLLYKDEIGGLTIGAEKKITRMDVIRVLGALLDDTEMNSHDVAGYFSDFIPEQNDDTYNLYKLIKNDIIKGYEDGTVRTYENLTRAEAATIFSRFYKIKDIN